ncbi:hypothetical protein L7F22_060388 [Adiantum nelumboides]|nr:hypothetical protein [Adiantum nelumboides]
MGGGRRPNAVRVDRGHAGRSRRGPVRGGQGDCAADPHRAPGDHRSRGRRSRLRHGSGLAGVVDAGAQGRDRRLAPRHPRPARAGPSRAPHDRAGRGDPAAGRSGAAHAARRHRCRLRGGARRADGRPARGHGRAAAGRADRSGVRLRRPRRHARLRARRAHRDAARRGAGAGVRAVAARPRPAGVPAGRGGAAGRRARRRRAGRDGGRAADLRAALRPAPGGRTARHPGRADHLGLRPHRGPADLAGRAHVAPAPDRRPRRGARPAGHAGAAAADPPRRPALGHRPDLGCGARRGRGERDPAVRPAARHPAHRRPRHLDRARGEAAGARRVRAGPDRCRLRARPRPRCPAGRQRRGVHRDAARRRGDRRWRGRRRVHGAVLRRRGLRLVPGALRGRHGAARGVAGHRQAAGHPPADLRPRRAGPAVRVAGAGAGRAVRAGAGGLLNHRLPRWTTTARSPRGDRAVVVSRSGRSGLVAGGGLAAGPAAQLVDVVVRGARGLRGVGDHAQVAGRRVPALVGVQHVDEREDAAVEGGDAQPQLLVHAQLAALPAVELAFVVLGDVVEHDEHLRARFLHHGGERALPGVVLAAERQPPALEPPGPGHRRVRGALLHLLGVHVRPVRGIQRHACRVMGSPAGPRPARS